MPTRMITHDELHKTVTKRAASVARRCASVVDIGGWVSPAVKSGRPRTLYRTTLPLDRRSPRRGTKQRREWDSNPRWVAPHTLSKRADSAALASLPVLRACRPLGWTKGSGQLADSSCHRSSPVGSEVTVGSCATGAREPGQDREVAAFSGTTCVPQTAWPSPRCSPAGDPQPDTGKRQRVARVENSSSRSMTAKARSGTTSNTMFWRRNSALSSGASGPYLAR